VAKKPKKPKKPKTQSSTPPPPTSNPDPLTNAWTYDGHSYQLVREGRDWEAARKDAITRGGYLAEINSSSENSIVFEAILSNGGLETPIAGDGGDARYVWLGASDINQEGLFVWSRSLKPIASTYQNWGSGSLGSEPDNFNDQDALAIGLENWPKGVALGQGFGDAGKWNDINTANKLFYLIEYDSIMKIL